MSDSPIMSYKKPSRKSLESAPPATAPASASSSPSTQSAASSPVATGNRKVSAGRKKLQEFYNLQAELKKKQEETDQQNAGGAIDSSRQSSPATANGQQSEAAQSKPQDAEPYTTENSLSLLDDSEKLTTFLHSTPINDILKLRNSIAHELSSHDSAKKSIIYDNYYELIKLSEILGSLAGTGEKTDAKAAGFNSKIVDEKHLDTVFTELIDFVDNRVSHFNTKFEDLLQNSMSNYNSDGDNASVTAISGKDDKEFPEEVSRQGLAQEINNLIETDSLNSLSDAQRTKLVSDLKRILETNETNILLKNQINKVITGLSVSS